MQFQSLQHFVIVFISGYTGISWLGAHGPEYPGHCHWAPRPARPHWSGSNAGARARAAPRCSPASARRKGGPTRAWLGSVDAEDQTEPSTSGAATLWSPETTRSSMACGGGIYRKTGRDDDLDDDVDHAGEGKRVERNRKLTTET